MGERPSRQHSIDRIDNARGYEPGNCRWATHAENARNKRHHQRLTVDGTTHLVVEWAELTGIHVETLRARIRKGVEPSRVVLPPQRRVRAAA
jgi:hypothetical protein